MHINTHIPMLSPRFNKFLLNFCQLIDTILGTGDTVERGKRQTYVIVRTHPSVEDRIYIYL